MLGKEPARSVCCCLGTTRFIAAVLFGGAKKPQQVLVTGTETKEDLILETAVS